MMMISNPATFFIDGSNRREFTYEGGKRLFNWSPYGSGLSKSMESNVVFFANDVDHARDILRRLFEFWVECNDLYIQSQQKSDKRKRIAVSDYHGLSAARAAETGALRHYLSKMDQMVFTEVPTNQFFKVGWACNDSLNVYKR